MGIFNKLFGKKVAAVNNYSLVPKGLSEVLNVNVAYNKYGAYCMPVSSQPSWAWRWLWDRGGRYCQWRPPPRCSSCAQLSRTGLCTRSCRATRLTRHRCATVCCRVFGSRAIGMGAAGNAVVTAARDRELLIIPIFTSTLSLDVGQLFADGTVLHFEYIDSADVSL